MDMCINGVFYFQAQFAKQGRIACVLFEYRVNDDGVVGIVTAEDIGVGGREIGYLFGAYKKIRNEFVLNFW